MNVPSVRQNCPVLGYHSLSHLSKAFKKEVGVSPQRYRLTGKARAIAGSQSIARTSGITLVRNSKVIQIRLILILCCQAGIGQESFFIVPFF